MDLVAELVRAAGPGQTPSSLIESTAAEIGVRPDSGDRALVALALCRAGRRPEEVSSSLTWEEFESFCSELLKTSGFEVRQNMVLTKPRAQIDMVASCPSLILSVDCKHWKKTHSASALRGFARGQLKRSGLLRKSLSDSRPIASAIVSFSEPAGMFVEGVAVVPVRTLRTFLSSVESYAGFLTFR